MFGKWEQTFPQQLFMFLEAVRSSCSCIQTTGFLDQVLWESTQKQRPVSGPFSSIPLTSSKHSFVLFCFVPKLILTGHQVEPNSRTKQSPLLSLICFSLPLSKVQPWFRKDLQNLSVPYNLVSPLEDYINKNVLGKIKYSFCAKGGGGGVGGNCRKLFFCLLIL